jgi:hypothetical protein
MSHAESQVVLVVGAASEQPVKEFWVRPEAVAEQVQIVTQNTFGPGPDLTACAS